MSEARIARRILLEAEAIAQEIPVVLRRRGLPPAFSDWLLTEDRGMVWLFGVLDLDHIERLERYTGKDLLHHLSTAIGGRPIYLSNSSGMRYGILLSNPPQLPERLDFPRVREGYALLGQRYTGTTLMIPWPRLGHLLVAGMTRSGKSNFLRLLSYQGLSEGFALLLADMDGRTFPMLEPLYDRPGNAPLLAPIARTPEAMLQLIERALEECTYRAKRYGQVEGFPENLQEYNAAAANEGIAPLRRVLVILDEFNGAVQRYGGSSGRLATKAAELGWRGLKFGVHLVFAAQEFSKGVLGSVRDQVNAVFCFKIRSPHVARNIGVPDAVRIPEGRPGMAVTDRWGPVQTYYLDKARLIAQGQ